jgi:hypothetical protein
MATTFHRRSERNERRILDVEDLSLGMVVALGVGGGLCGCGVMGARWFAGGLIWWRVGIVEVDLRDDGWWDCRFWSPDHERRTNFPTTTAADSSRMSTCTHADLRVEDDRQRCNWMVGGSQIGMLRIGRSRVSGAQACEWRI